MSITNALSDKRLICVITVFILSRAVFFLAGVRFDASSIYYMWQYVDIELLSHLEFRCKLLGRAGIKPRICVTSIYI